MANETLDQLLAARIKPYNEMPTSNRQKILGVGYSKSGKTRFGGTIESDPSTLFIIDTDGSLDGLPPSAKSAPTLRISRDEVLNGKCKPYEMVDAVIRGIRDRTPMFAKVRTLMIDGLTTLTDCLMIELMKDVRVGKESRDPLLQKATYDEYGVLSARLMTIFTKIDDLDVNIYATAGVKNDKDEVSGMMYAFPDILGSFRNEASYRFNAIIYFTEEAGKYIVYTKTHYKFPAGVRNWIGPEKFEGPTYAKMFDPKNFATGGTK
jgi:hypothetical protein